MTSVVSPAKLNLSLIVSPPRPDGMHPLRSIVQTIEWCDRIEVVVGEGRDAMEIEGADLDPEHNLVIRALESLRASTEIPPLQLTLRKQIPMQTGLGGGSSNAAALLLAAESAGWSTRESSLETAPLIGSDVTLFLTGGSAEVSGVGEVVTRIEPLTGFAVAVAVPAVGLDTAAVYTRWDELDGPAGEALPEDLLPPSLRGGMPIRNDLTPAAMDLEPTLGDFMADLRSEWGTAVAMTGSGSACFAYFPTIDEAHAAAEAVTHEGAECRGVVLRPTGVAVDERADGD